MSIVEFIPKSDRQQQSKLITQIGDAVFGTLESAMFAEEFVPVKGQVPQPKAQNFANYLIQIPKCLWVVYSSESRDDVAGFILVADMPHHNSIGFGLGSKYSRQGLMSRAWKEIMVSPECIRFPLNAYTSVNNSGAVQFLKKNGFQFVQNTNFEGEPSGHYIFNQDQTE